MRRGRVPLKALAETAQVAANEFGGFDPELVRRMMVQKQGPKAAAWLLFKHRKTIHRTGHFLIHHDGPIETAPKWLRMAMALLEMRGRLWQVTVRERPGIRGGIQWIVFWKGWLSNGPRNRDELRRRERNKRKRQRDLRS